MVHFMYKGSSILNLTAFETDGNRIYCTAYFEYEGFKVGKSIKIEIGSLNDFRSELFFFNDNQRDEVELHDDNDFINIKIKKGPIVTISINACLPLSISLKAEYATQFYQLENVYKEFDVEMELLGFYDSILPKANS